MYLDKNYFNNIQLDTIRRKFYNADAVDRLLVDIRSKSDIMTRELLEAKAGCDEAQKAAESLREENEDLRKKGKALSTEILSLREDLKTAQSNCRDVQEAADPDLIRRDVEEQVRQECSEMLEHAKAEAEEILSEANAKLSEARLKAEESARQIGQQREDLLRQLEAFFAAEREKQAEAANQLQKRYAALLDSLREDVSPAPGDLGEKIDRIVQEVREIDDL